MPAGSSIVLLQHLNAMNWCIQQQNFRLVMNIKWYIIIKKNIWSNISLIFPCKMFYYQNIVGTVKLWYILHVYKTCFCFGQYLQGNFTIFSIIIYMLIWCMLFFAVEFMKLCEIWHMETWTWMGHFQTDMLIYQVWIFKIQGKLGIGDKQK